MSLHLLKLCVGANSVDNHRDWIANRMAERAARGEDPRPFHTTRMWPKRADQLLDGGSLYWVVKGMVASRQRIDDLAEQIGEDGIRRCRIILDPKLILVQPRPKRPFQGWRYLKGTDAPPDLRNQSATQIHLPHELARELDHIGVVAY